MKKMMLMMTGFALAILVLGVAGFASAQTQTPPVGASQSDPLSTDGDVYTRRGPGMTWGDQTRTVDGANHPGMMAGYAADGSLGLMHDFMLSAFADVLGIDLAELQERLDAGETMWQIAEAEGLSIENFQALMLAARTEALNQAVADGTITQEQADWMLSRWNSMQQNGLGLGSGPCQDGESQGSRGAGGRGAGRGARSGSQP